MSGPLVVTAKQRAADDPGQIATAFRQIERWSQNSAFTRENIWQVNASTAAYTVPDVFTATLFYITLTANCTFTFPQAMTGKNFAMALKQDATGSRTATWPATVKWAGGTAPTLTTTAGKIDTFSFLCYDGINWLAYTTGQNF